MKTKDCLLFLCVVILGLNSCKDLRPTKSRIFIIQKVILNGGRCLFWFRDEQSRQTERMSYFQLTNDQCELSINKANAYCNSAVQINNFLGDTILILTRDPLVVTKSDSWVSFKSIEYSPELYDSNKNPIPEKQFFLDSLCSQK